MAGAPDLSVRIGKLWLKNPVMPASGTFGYGEEYAPFMDLNELGAVVVKTLTLRPRLGSPPHRSVEVPSGILASIGLQNVGVERFLAEKLPFFQGLDTRLIVSIGGETVDEYRRMARVLDGVARVDAIEVNVSCPNVRKGGVHFGTDPDMVEALASEVRDATDKTLMVKLSPMAGDIQRVAVACQKAGADALTLINAPVGMAVDIRSRTSKLGRNRTGGLAGPAIRPLALYLVWQAVRAVDIPVVGVGGICSAEDTLEFLMAGATAVQIGTWNFVHPSATVEVIHGLGRFMKEQGLMTVREVIDTVS